MFLLKSLYKYFNMNTSFRVSLLYLLLIIPQHGNSPLPAVESWLQKDQDDGVIQRDMTSSLTGGDESFGSAHQTYQNSLIRKKKADTSGNLLPSVGYRKFAVKPNRNQVQANPFFDSRYVNQDFSLPSIDATRSGDISEDFNAISEMPYHRKFKLRPSNTIGDEFSSFNKNFQEDADSIMNARLNLRQNQLTEGLENNPDWLKWGNVKDNYSPATRVSGVPQPIGYAVPGANEMGKNQELSDSNGFEIQSPQINEESDYYDNGADQNAVDETYNQVLRNRAYPHKRENPKTNEPLEGAKVVFDAFKYGDRNRRFNDDLSQFDTMQDTLENSGVFGNTRNLENVNFNLVPEGKFTWKLNSDVQSEALTNLMRNSQRALQEVRQFQQKLYNKQPDGSESEGPKRESRNPSDMNYGDRSNSFDEKRLKREDEDEQKNMKTGTDEGGGGEYEDEEGKGHKDEEEYYEDADLSDEDSGNEVRTTDEDSEQYVKREVAEDHNAKNSKTQPIEENSEDYELNLENAPVENLEKSKKSLYREDNPSY